MNTRDSLRQYIVQNLIHDKKYKKGERQLGDTDRLISGGLIDSFSLADLAIFIESTFDFSPDNTDLNAEQMDTVEMIANYVDAHRK